MSVLDYIDPTVFDPVYKGKLPMLVSPNVDKICREIYYAIKAQEPIFIYGDYDMDGFCAAKVWGRYCLHCIQYLPSSFSIQKECIV